MGKKEKIVSMAIYGENRDKSKSQDIGNKKRGLLRVPFFFNNTNVTTWSRKH